MALFSSYQLIALDRPIVLALPQEFHAVWAQL